MYQAPQCFLLLAPDAWLHCLHLFWMLSCFIALMLFALIQLFWLFYALASSFCRSPSSHRRHWIYCNLLESNLYTAFPHISASPMLTSFSLLRPTRQLLTPPWQCRNYTGQISWFSLRHHLNQFIGQSFGNQEIADTLDSICPNNHEARQSFHRGSYCSMDRCYSLIKVVQAVGADIYQVFYSFNFVFIHTIPADAFDWGLK